MGVKSQGYSPQLIGCWWKRAHKSRLSFFTMPVRVLSATRMAFGCESDLHSKRCSTVDESKRTGVKMMYDLGLLFPNSTNSTPFILQFLYCVYRWLGNPGRKYLLT